MTSPPPVTVTSLAPAGLNAGAPATVLTVTGSGFVTSSIVQWNGTALSTSYVSPTSLTANVPAADFNSPGTASVTVTNGSGAASSAPMNFTIGEQTAPMVSTLTPATVTAGNPAFQLVVTGTNFLSSATVQWNGTAIPTTFDSATQLTAAVTAAQVAAVASVPITVLNDPAAGGTSNIAHLAVVAPVPVTLTSLSPTGLTAGAPDTVLTVTGSGFMSSSVVQWNGTPLTTNFVSATSLTATVPAADLASPSSVAVTVTDGAGAASSAAVTFVIGEQTAPIITALAPAAVTVGNPAFALVVTGANFLSTATVQWNGSALPTTFDSSTQLTAQVTAAQVAAAASVSVTVANDPGAGGTSNVVPFTVVTQSALLPAPTLTSLSPKSAAENAQGVALTISGTNFTPTTLVSYNGTLVQPNSVTQTQLTISSINTSFASGTTINIAVEDPASGNVLSNGLQLAITNAVPVPSSISPASIVAGQGALALTVEGQFFTATSQVYFNGSARPTTLTSGALVAQLTAADVASAGTASITVEDSASGNVASNAVSLDILALPPLTVTEVSPATVPAGNSSFTLTVIGTGFATGSTIDWGGTALTTTFVSSSELQATVTAALVASTGTQQVTVVNPASAGGTVSAATAVTIAPPSKDAVALQINSAHTGSIAFNSLTLPAAASWSINVGGTPSYALVVNGIVYVSVQMSTGNSQLLALNGSTGATVWGPVALGGYGMIAYDSGTIFVTGGSYLATTLSAFNATTGSPLWSESIADAIEGAPPVASNGLVFTVGDGELQAFDEKTGAQVWEGGFGGTDGTVAVTVDGVYGAAPCTAEDFLPATGAVIWSTNTGCEGGGGATPVVGGGELFAPIAVAGSYSGNIYNAESGVGLATFGYSTLPAVTTSNIYALSGSTLQGLALSNNQVLWSFGGDGTLVTSPVVVNNSSVFVGATSGNVYAVNAATGVVQQTWNVGASAIALSAGDGLLIVPAGTNVTAFVLSASP